MRVNADLLKAEMGVLCFVSYTTFGLIYWVMVFGHIPLRFFYIWPFNSCHAFSEGASRPIS